MPAPLWTSLGHSGRWARGLLFLAIGPLFILFAFALPAQAHPTLLETLPQGGYSYSQSPVEVGVVFDQPVTVQRLTVIGQARGPVATSKTLRSPNGTHITVIPDRPLPVGNYTVRWQITAGDGDLVDGTFDFAIGVKSALAPSSNGSTDTTAVGKVAWLRWLLFGGIALSLGGIIGDTMVADRKRRAQLTRDLSLTAPRPWILHGSLLGLFAVMGLALVHLGRGDLLDGLTGFSIQELMNSESGRILLVEIAGFSISALASSQSYRPVAISALAAVVGAEAWRSHLHAASAWFGTATIGIHLLVAVLWVGVLVHLVRTALRWREDRRQVVALFRRYATFALSGYVLVIASGTFAAILVLPSWGALTSTTYGRVLLVKLGAVVVISILALAARRGLRRPISGHIWRGLRFARLERATLVLVLGVSALLTAVSPAPATRESFFPPPIDEPTVHLGTLAGQVSTGLIASDGHLQLRLHVPESTATAVQQYQVSGHAQFAGGRVRPLTLKPCGTGCFDAPIAWPLKESVVHLSVRATGWEGGNPTFVVPWPPRDGHRTFERMLDTMVKQPKVLLTEKVTSNTRGLEGMSSRLRLSGSQLISAQPYRSGIVSKVVVLGQTAGSAELGFALAAEGIFVRMNLDPAGRIQTETILTPNHLLIRSYAYPAA